jgi:phosphate transport system substrate-binding protein
VARDFVVNFALGEAGQRIVDATGFVSPLFRPPQPPAPCAADLPAYCALVEGADRIPFDVRFSPGTDQVDNRAFRNLDLLGQLLSAPENRGRRLLLIGFADNAGTDEANQALSESRAAQVARELAARGITVDTQTAGFGEAPPVDTNATPEGREQNRRVEIWLR